ncbi:hypothetical protein ISCGN_021148 [Ixodes scapularis]
MRTFIASGFGAARGRVQQRYPQPFANNSRSRGAVHLANRDCTGIHVIVLLVNGSFSPSAAHSLVTLSLCGQEWGGRSVRWNKQRLLDGVNAPARKDVVDV